MRIMPTIGIVLTVLLLSTQFSSGQEEEGKQKKKRPKNRALQAVDDVDGLPRVLLIGDSISMAYTIPVREMLSGVANVHRPPTNCGPTTKGVEQIDKWLGDKKWDVIHFNFGLHDLKYMGPAGQNLADPKKSDSKPQVPIAEYEENLNKLVKRLQQTGAKLIWRSTTPVPEGARGRVVGDSVKYNEVAKKIMDANNIPIDDQYAFALQRMKELQKPRDVHFTRKGSRSLAEQTVLAVRKALESETAK